MSDFKQPTLDDGVQQADANLPATVTAVVTDNSDKDDELSVAVREANKPVAVAVEPEKPRGPGKYQLDYVYNGQRIHETHETVRHAIARVAGLKRLGIVPATSTAK